MSDTSSRIITVLLIVCMLIVPWGTNAQTDKESPDASPQCRGEKAEFASGEVLVRFATGVEVSEAGVRTDSVDLNRRLTQYGCLGMERVFRAVAGAKLPKTYRGADRRARPFPDLSRVYRLRFSEGADVLAIVRELSRCRDVVYAEPNYRIRLNLVPNDPYYSSSGSWGQGFQDLWGLYAIQAAGAWDLSTGSSDIVVAVIDTGGDYNHADLAANVWVNTGEVAGNGSDDDGNGYIDDIHGWDFCNSDNDPIDDQGHGSHVWGTIAAATDNGTGVAGISWQSRVMPVKFLDAEGSGYDSDAAEALQYAADNGARVINNSWGGDSPSSVLEDAVNYAYGLGCVIVAAAGNDGSSAPGYPAAYEGVISVAATDHTDSTPRWSNYGSTIDLAAPGVDILSVRAAGTSLGTTVGNYYTVASGTSMASPHVAGVAALVLALHPSFANYEVEAVLLSSSDDLGDPGWDQYFGHGRLNAYQALQMETSPPTPTPGPSPTSRPPDPNDPDAPDPYEDDDTCADANLVTVGADPLTHNFHDAGDQDWIEFVAQAGQSYVIETSYLGYYCDTYIYLYDTDCTTLIDSNDDGGVGLASRIVWQCSTGGTYAVGIEDFVWWQYGAGTQYDVGVTLAESSTYPPDAYEPDDTCAHANLVTVDAGPLTHNFHDGGDHDWIKFTAEAGQSYIIETSNLEYNCDTYISLYDTDCTTIIESDDDGGVGYASRIEWHCSSAGIYAVKMRHYYSSRYGEGTEYDAGVVSIETDWEVRAAMNVARIRLGVAAVNGKVYAIGGQSASSSALGNENRRHQREDGIAADDLGALDFEDAVEEYNPVTDSWITRTPKPTSVSNVSAAVLDGKIYVPGGYDGGGGVSVVEVYDPATDTWSSVASLAIALFGHATVAVGGKLYVIGGRSGGTESSDCYQYDPGTDIWAQRASMNHERAWLDAGVVNGKIYAVGGVSGSSDDVDYVEEYDPSTNTWTVKAPMSTARGGPGAVGVGGYLYVVGGGWNSYLGSAERYDPSTDSWASFDRLNFGRRTLGLVETGGKLYAVGGWVGDFSGHNEEYDLGASADPDISVTPDSFEVTLSPGQNTKRVMTIGNVGEGTLHFNLSESSSSLSSAVIPGIGNGSQTGSTSGASGDKRISTTDVPWLSQSPTSGSVDPSEAQEIDVAFNATGLSVDDYTASVVIASNDPDENQIIVPVTLHVSDCGAGVVPKHLYADAYGLNSTLDDALIPVGSCILAFDPDEVNCGAFVVKTSGQYGTMHIYGDDGSTPEDEGAEAGDEISFTINDYLATPDSPLTWGDKQQTRVELAAHSSPGLRIDLDDNWNLFSFNVEPRSGGEAVSEVEEVLASIDGHYSAVLAYYCSDGGRSYYPDLDPGLNDLTELDSQHGYWIQMNARDTLELIGPLVAYDTPLELCAGWNLVSYLPTVPISVADALESIEGKYSAVLGYDRGALSYYPDIPPEFNDLQTMGPGDGYWILMDTAATLVYPNGPAASAAGQRTSSLDVTPTYDWRDFYSTNTTWNGNAVPAMAVIDAYDPDGVHCGRFTVTTAGWWGTMHVYADDPGTLEDEGAEIGDTITFTINGETATVVTGDATWASKEPKQVALAGGVTAASVPLAQGWNLISVPLSPASTAVTDVLSSIEGKYDLVYAYHASDTGDPWKKYNTAAPPSLNDLTEIDETMGLWIRVTEPATLIVSGSVPSSTDIPLYTGWNLVGYPSQTTRAVTEALASIEGKYDLIYAYDASDAEDPWKKHNTAAPPSLNDLTEMVPAWGYWIRASEDCTWGVSGG